MYKSIIDIIHTDMEIKMEGEIMKAVQRCNIEVDKEELLKALRYDRDQYDKGYQDGLNADKWIPCEERLPSDSEIHEVTAQFSNGRLYTEFAYYDESREEWWKIDDDGTVNVIAWKEHSEPYKKEGAENE